MAVTIDATTGGASSNSYATLATAETYMESRLNADLWDAATDDSKNRALVEATREIDVLTYDGKRATDTQALSWPRYWAVDPDDPNGDYYGVTTLPTRVVTATCELAFQFIKAGTTDLAVPDPTDGVIRKKIDVLETEYARPYERRVVGLQRFPRVWDLLNPLLVPGSVGVTIPVIRG
jgi:hypothetical protein